LINIGFGGDFPCVYGPLGALSGPGPRVPSPLPLFLAKPKKELRFAGGATQIRARHETDSIKVLSKPVGVFPVPATISTPPKTKPHSRCLGCGLLLILRILGFQFPEPFPLGLLNRFKLQYCLRRYEGSPCQRGHEQTRHRFFF